MPSLQVSRNVNELISQHLNLDVQALKEINMSIFENKIRISMTQCQGENEIFYPPIADKFIAIGEAKDLLNILGLNSRKVTSLKLLVSPNSLLKLTVEELLQDIPADEFVSFFAKIYPTN
jgi:hypothetical protein